MSIKIAVTGGIGSGKSTALAYLQKLGYRVFSCDEIYQEIIKSDEYVQAVAQLFPTVIVGGKIDRTKLADIVFSDSNKREQLNSLAHPLIMNELIAQMDDCKEKYVFAEVPLLFEGNFESEFDYVIVIMRETPLRIEALKLRDNLSIEKIKERIASQFNYSSSKGIQRLKDCNAFIIQNDADEAALENKIKILLQKF